jgi:hypothetical protein
MTTEPNFGPHLQQENVKDFFEISKKSFEIYHEKVTHELVSKFDPVQHLFIRQLYLAETTSFSIRLLASWGMFLQTLALARIRLEHTIVCSYLIHEKESIGLNPFVKHISINGFLNAQAAMSDAGIAKQLNLDISKLQTDAINAQTMFNPDFDIDHDKFERKWTKLDLRTMAQHRDKLTAKKISVSKTSLETDYVSLYKTASSIVHSDVSALSYAFMDVFVVNPKSRGVILPLPSWGTMSMAFTSRYDIVQVFETLKYLEIDCESEFVELEKIWRTSIKKHMQ